MRGKPGRRSPRGSLTALLLVNVYKAMGGGWVDEADKLAPRPAPGVDAPGGGPRQ